MNNEKEVSSVLRRKILIGVMAFQGLSGLVGGFGLMADPSGASLQIPLEWLEGSPFTDYLIPGIVLFLILGVIPLGVVVGLRKRMRWSRHAAIAVGVALCIWIAVEIAVIGYQADPPLQLIYGIVGIAILLLSLSLPKKAP